MDAAISLCSEMHEMKEAIYENKKKLEGIGEDYQIQVLVGGGASHKIAAIWAEYNPKFYKMFHEMLDSKPIILLW